MCVCVCVCVCVSVSYNNTEHVQSSRVNPLFQMINHNNYYTYQITVCGMPLGSGTTLKDKEDVPLVEFMCLIFTRMPGESYRRRLRSLLLCLCDVFRALINSLFVDL